MHPSTHNVLELPTQPQTHIHTTLTPLYAFVSSVCLFFCGFYIYPSSFVFYKKEFQSNLNVYIYILMEIEMLFLSLSRLTLSQDLCVCVCVFSAAFGYVVYANQAR